MDFSDLSDDERLILGLRFRLKHVREAMSEAKAGRVPDGFEFAEDETKDCMLVELQRIEAEVQGMLRGLGANDSGRSN